MRPERKNNSSILLGYYVASYDGVDEPTIVIDTQELATLLKVRALFLELAESKRQYIDLTQLDPVETLDIDQLILRSLPGNHWPIKYVKRLAREIDKLTFEYSLPVSGWETCVRLTDGLVSSGRPGHQYLPEGQSDDATVELAFME